MDSLPDQQKMSQNEMDFLLALRIATAPTLPLVLKAAIDLDLLEIMAAATASNSMLSPTEIASRLPTQNPDAPTIVDRLLRLLASHSILTCKLVAGRDEHAQRLYGLGPVGKYFVRNQEGNSLVPTLRVSLEKFYMECWYHLKEAALEGVLPFMKVHGMHLFELAANDDKVSSMFNASMSNLTSLVMKKVLETYKGFEGLSQVVDVGGGVGANLNLLVSKYPQIKGTNFDLPHVIRDAPLIPGVEHVGGDMFSKVPKGEVIFMKWILHDWGDEQCLKLLKNCFEALPENGKVVIVESLTPEFPMTDIVTKITFELDVSVLHMLPGAKERTKQEFEALAREAGFKTLNVVCRIYSYWVMELCKNVNIAN
ncbi:PREDICTED: caffeic acid 3-O-methyltransferase [Theobroma cacao]|uniref:Caffeic acid 3-O-methyltransferase n=1 Tax=Theobroma cacao TaxID=3641 RepID=A0AB32WAK0_THECC|nr:PREDICTED: caffeic acid 3-O-methyltransferase [Theobroma cacao]